MIAISPTRSTIHATPPPRTGVTDGPAHSRWIRLAERTFYFGHQSVGNDIVAGLEGLTEQHALGIRFVQTRTPAAVAGPAFVHFLAGGNADPASKNAALVQVLDARPAADRGIALLKYCYADVHAASDVRRLFDEYRAMAATIRSRHPDVTVVHTTVPLTTVESETKARVKRLLGRGTVRAAAAARQRYNELVRDAFRGREPLFDIAAVEAGECRGARANFSYEGRAVETLVPGYTYDGGHLNSSGRAVVARALLDVLADVVEWER
jgi:hypothetical protein